MEHKFSRTEILIGPEGLETLNRRHVMVFGVGGVGSFAVEALARAGVGKLTIVDHDNITLSNLNRQLHALHSTLGQAKVEIMLQRIKDINPEAEIIALQEFYDSEKAEKFFNGPKIDYIVDAIDSVASKVSLIKESLKHDIPIISSMGAGNRLSAANFKVTDISQTTTCPLAKVMRKSLRQEGIIQGVKVVFSPDPPLTPREKEDTPSTETLSSTSNPLTKKLVPGSISFVPSVVGLLIAGEVIRDLVK